MSSLYDEEIVEYNESLLSDDDPSSTGADIVVFSRDWTVETIVSQIKQGNIDLDPDYQRRNAWQDDKRSKLIESLIMEYPVPEVVLAENPKEKKKYLVIDGKQRLMAIYGFFEKDYKSWKKPVLKGLRVKKELNGSSVTDLSVSDHRSLVNSDLRCTVISNYTNENVLYDIFYRLNTGSSPLTTQELRQVLHKGPFAKFLINATNSSIPLHQVLNLRGPDNRLKDSEILLKFISVEYFFSDYDGNLKAFLDNSMGKLNNSWSYERSHIHKTLSEFNKATELLIEVFGSPKQVGRKWDVKKEKWEGRFNRSVFESQVHYALRILGSDFHHVHFVQGVQEAFHDIQYRDSVEATTKTLENHRKRLLYMKEVLNRKLGLDVSYEFLKV